MNYSLLNFISCLQSTKRQSSNKKTLFSSLDKKRRNVNSIAIKEDVVSINQKENSITKTSHNDSFAISRSEDNVPISVYFDKKNSTLNKISMNSKNSKSDYSKNVSNNLEMMNQKAHLMKTTNESKKRRFRCKKRCKKRRFKNSQK